MNKIVANLKSAYAACGRNLGAAFVAPSKSQAQALLFVVGVALLAAGLSTAADAQLTATYNDSRLADALNHIMAYIEGTFGAMVMVASGIGAILSSAFGQYRAALGLLVVAVGAFILRSLVSTFFNDANIRQ